MLADCARASEAQALADAPEARLRYLPIPRRRIPGGELSAGGVRHRAAGDLNVVLDVGDEELRFQLAVARDKGQVGVRSAERLLPVLNPLIEIRDVVGG